MSDLSPDKVLLDHCSVGLSLHDPSGQFLAVSGAYATVLGHARGHLLGLSIVHLADPSDREQLTATWDAAVMRRQATTIRFRLVNTDAVIAADLEPVERDGTLSVVCTSRRADDYPRAELDHSHDALARVHRDALVNLLPALVWYGTVSPDLSNYKVAYFSDNLTKITGYTREQWLETPGFWLSVIHPDDREKTVAATAVMMRGHSSDGPCYRLRTSDGSYLWMQSFLSIGRDASGIPERIYGITLDVTTYIETRERNTTLERDLVAKARELLQVSAPILPIGQETLLMPLIGILDRERTEHAVANLLEAVHQRRARRVIFDLTGLSSTDPGSLHQLLTTAQALRLLGASVALSGIRPAVAELLLTLALPLTGLRSYNNLATALQHPGPHYKNAQTRDRMK